MVFLKKHPGRVASVHVKPYLESQAQRPHRR